MKCVKGECQDTRNLPLEERNVKFNELQLIKCMNNRSKSNFHNINSDKECKLTELAQIKYDKVEKSEVLWIETVQQELSTL